ncbi:hypothetical protein [Streptomyces sp. UG1]|uniref:hypothetical protein n=1 Tax=Streptomyces sp. UG1 TaxID=3417652 RepID=UPI003CEA6E8F
MLQVVPVQAVEGTVQPHDLDAVRSGKRLEHGGGVVDGSHDAGGVLLGAGLHFCVEIEGFGLEAAKPGAW